MDKKYLMERIKKLEEENKRLTDLLIDAKHYEGRWFELKDRVDKGEFEEFLEEIN